MAERVEGVEGVRAAIALLILYAAAPARAEDDRETRAAWNRPAAPFRVVGSVYSVGVAGLSAWLIATPKGAILVDAGLPESAPLIEDNIRKLGFQLADVKLLVNSHAHFDHAGGLAELKRASGARLVASRGDAPDLAAGRSRYFGDGPDGSFPKVAVDRVIDDGATVELGGVTLTALLTPGHTPGCTTWTLPVEERGRTLRVVLHCSTSAPGYRLVGNPRYPGIVEDYRRTFARLKALPCDVLLAPHPSFIHLDDKRARLAAGGENPFVDSGELARFVAQSEADFTRQLERERARRSP
jgi:metallo-beta-lactamase class B